MPDKTGHYKSYYGKRAKEKAQGIATSPALYQSYHSAFS